MTKCRSGISCQSLVCYQWPDVWECFSTLIMYGIFKLKFGVYGIGIPLVVALLKYVFLTNIA